MGATNKTPNIELPQFVGTDKPSWLGDFNGAMNAIDTFAGKTTGDIGTVTGTANAAKSAADAASASVAALETTVNQHTTEISDTMADVSALEADVANINGKINGITKVTFTMITGNRYVTSWLSANFRLLRMDNYGEYYLTLPSNNININTTTGAYCPIFRFSGNLLGLPAQSNAIGTTANVEGYIGPTALAVSASGQCFPIDFFIFYNSTYDFTYICAQNNYNIQSLTFTSNVIALTNVGGGTTTSVLLR